MTTALRELEIPLVVTPLNMSSPELDELSAITYLSYFIREGSPGYRATLRWIQSVLTDERVENFNVNIQFFLKIIFMVLYLSSRVKEQMKLSIN